MSEVKRKLGDPVKLRLSLNRDETTKYVRAFLTDEVGDPVGAGQLDLPHIANGVYGENALLMPNLDFDVKYRVYFDEDFTIIDPTYPSAFDSVRLDTGVTVEVEEGKGVLEAEIEGVVEEDVEVAGEAVPESDMDLEGVVEEEVEL